MDNKKPRVGDIRPIYNITGFQVCKGLAEDSKELQWTPVEKISDAEILSFIYQQSSAAEVEEPVEEEPKKVKKKMGRPKKIVEEDEDEESQDEELARLQAKIKELKEGITDDDL